MYLIAFFRGYYLDRPRTIEVSDLAGARCIASAFTTSRISYVLKRYDEIVDSEFFTERAQQQLAPFMQVDEANA